MTAWTVTALLSSRRDAVELARQLRAAAFRPSAAANPSCSEPPTEDVAAVLRQTDAGAGAAARRPRGPDHGGEGARRLLLRLTSRLSDTRRRTGRLAWNVGGLG